MKKAIHRFGQATNWTRLSRGKMLAALSIGLVCAVVGKNSLTHSRMYGSSRLWSTASFFMRERVRRPGASPGAPVTKKTARNRRSGGATKSTEM